MRRKISLAALFAAFGLALALVFTACNNGSSPVFATCVVSYSSERGTPPAQKTVFAGTTLSEADLPALTAEGYVFGGWFDGETQAVAGKYVVAKNVTLTAKWTAAPTPATTLDLSTVTADTVIKDNTIVTGTLAGNYKISIADGATITLKDVTINGTDDASYKWAGLTCAGDATITLEEANTLKGFWKYYPGLFVPKGKTLTIKGSGSLAADSNGYGAGIGGCYAVAGSSDIPKEEGSCGKIVIEGGTITATGGMSAGIGCGYGSDCDGVTITGGTVTATGGTMAAGIGSGGSNSVCGPISISGGTVTATGGQYAAGVGTGYLGNSECGAITVANTVTKFTATKGTNATDSVGHGKNGGACGAVTIGGTVYWDGSAYQNEGATVLGQSPYTYQPSPAPGPTPGTTLDLSTVTADTTVADGYTITGTLANNVKISIAAGATVTLKNASINADGTWTSGDYAGLNCLGDATITLEAGTTNTVKGFKITYPGIHVPSGKTLTINGSGALTVSPNTSGAGMSATGAGIGGGVGLPCGNIVIAGGTITASTANHAAAIGSGGAGYGSGQTCGDISITGGTVTATCVAQYGAGIGAGINGECGNISITGGTVTASGSQSAGGAGIGCGGTKSTVGTITIADTVTKVTAVKGLNAQSIGKGNDSGTCVCGTITIGGTPYADGITESPYTYPKIVDLSTITANTVIQDGYTVIGSTTAGKKIQIADGATVTLKNIDIKCSAYKVNGIECLGNAILILEGANKVETTEQDYAAIYAGPEGKTLTIRGDGSLTVKAYNYGAAIGSNTSNTVSGTVCGNITIESGTIVATGGAQAAAIGAGSKGQCGNIVISGGTVTANGCADGFDQWSGAGIGTGSDKTSVCGTITISGDNTKVTATRGNVNGTDCIGQGTGSWDTTQGKNVRPTCGTVTIGGETGYKTEASYTYNPSGR